MLEQCIPGHHGPSVLDDRLLSTAAEKGYLRSFHPGPPVETAQTKVSPTSLMAFAYVATPAVPGKTGVRTFCGDATGRICYAMGAVVPEAGFCPASCRPF